MTTFRITTYALVRVMVPTEAETVEQAIRKNEERINGGMLDRLFTKDGIFDEADVEYTAYADDYVYVLAEDEVGEVLKGCRGPAHRRPECSSTYPNTV